MLSLSRLHLRHHAIEALERGEPFHKRAAHPLQPRRPPGLDLMPSQPRPRHPHRLGHMHRPHEKQDPRLQPVTRPREPGHHAAGAPHQRDPAAALGRERAAERERREDQRTHRHRGGLHARVRQAVRRHDRVRERQPRQRFGVHGHEPRARRRVGVQRRRQRDHAAARWRAQRQVRGRDGFQLRGLGQVAGNVVVVAEEERERGGVVGVHVADDAGLRR